MYLKKILDWQKYRKESFLTHFFDNVDIENENIKKSIINWISKLNAKNIQIDNFSFFFTNYKEIVFPIKICGHPQHLQLEDFNGNHFYFCYNQFYGITEYYIGKRTKDFDEQLTYLLTKENEILLKDFEVIKLDNNGINTSPKISFNYNLDDDSTTVILETKLKHGSILLEVNYKTVDLEHSNKIIFNLFDLLDKTLDTDNIFLVTECLLSDVKKILESKSILTTTSFTKIIK